MRDFAPYTPEDPWLSERLLRCARRKLELMGGGDEEDVAITKAWRECALWEPEPEGMHQWH